MSNVLQIQKMVFNILKTNNFLTNRGVSINNYMAFDLKVKYPFVRVSYINKVVDDSFSEQIEIVVSVLSDAKTSSDIISIVEAIESDFKNANLLSRQHLNDPLLGLSVVSQIKNYRITQTEIFQDSDLIFNANITINFSL